MTEHETFKAMCDRIWYDISKNLWYLWFQYHEWNLYKFLWDWFKHKSKEWFLSNSQWLNMFNNQLYVIVDVREIIFTTEFLENLNNPAEYLYNLIK
jgi:hypothetical protein